MDIKITFNGDIISLGDKVRIERGHCRRNAVATKELLSNDVTAAHYFAGMRKVSEGGKTVEKVGIDALGKPIVLGEPMDYIDWKSPERAWYLYQMDKDGIWQKVGPYAGYTEQGAAMTAGLKLIGGK